MKLKNLSSCRLGVTFKMKMWSDLRSDGWIAQNWLEEKIRERQRQRKRKREIVTAEKKMGENGSHNGFIITWAWLALLGPSQT